MAEEEKQTIAEGSVEVEGTEKPEDEKEEK
jgi:hypothetical protein